MEVMEKIKHLEKSENRYIEDKKLMELEKIIKKMQGTFKKLMC